jgi:hypothetical protein
MWSVAEAASAPPQSDLLKKTGDAGRVQFRAPAFPSPAQPSALPSGKQEVLLQLDRNRQGLG